MADTTLTTVSAKIQPHQILFFNRQLASMARLNMPLAKGVKILAKEVKKGPFKAVLQSVQNDLEEGVLLSDALAKFPDSFSTLYLEVLRSGESSGNLAAILEELTTYSESMMKIKTQIQAALMYPAVICIGISLFTAFFLTVITPTMKQMVDQASRAGSRVSELSLPTKMVFAASDVALTWWVSLPLLIVFFAGLLQIFRTFQKMGSSYDDFLFRLPLFGKLFHRATLMKLTRTMRELLVNGVSMVNTLRLATNIVGENRVKVKLHELTAAVEEGGSFSRNLASGNVFPDTMVWKLQMAEEKGIVEDALRELASEFESEVENLTIFVTKFLSPLLLIMMAGVVLFLVLAAFIPLTKLSQF
jgi:type II secretory pathway component PulF